MTTLLILGATGQVGGQLLQQALDDTSVARVIAPTRRPLSPHAKLENPLVDYRHLPDADWWRADAALCALGTTRRQAGSSAAFEAVDRHHVVAAAKRVRAAGTPTFVLNSSLGANPTAKSLYLRVKGQVEADLQALGFCSFTAVRPSLLQGGRRVDWRPAEALGLAIARALRPVIPPRYRAVTTAAVAAAMRHAAKCAVPGNHVIESEQIAP